jgi:glycosyltransferase involved in cell wall biosynthesis
MDRRLSIVYVITSLEGGGAEMMLYKLAAHLNPQEFRVAVVSLIEPSPLVEKFQAAKIPVYSIGMKRGGVPTLPMFWRLIQQLRQLQPDLIQGRMYHGNLAAQIASFFLFQWQIPVLWSIHYTLNSLATDPPLTRFLIEWGSNLSRFPAKILFVSKLSQQQHIELGYAAEKCLVIPNGFNIDAFAPNPAARSSIRAELGLAADATIVGSFARYNPMKDHPNLLRAAALLHQQHPDIHFLLAGENVDRQNQTLQALITELNLTDRVHLLGERRDVSMLMAGLDVLTTSSAYGEAFPNVIGEAMSCGVPCVVTDVGESSQIVGDTGRVVPPQDAQALARAWQDILEMGHEARVQLGLAARRRIVDNFSLAAIVPQHEALYKSLLASG